MNDTHLTQLASRASVTVALVLTIVKLYAVYTTQSLSILSSLFDSSMDMLASIANLIAITIASRPADQKFRFGYGKLEAVSALLQSLLIIISLLFLITEAIQRLFQSDSSISNPEFGISVMIFSIVLTLALTAFQQYVIKRTHSIAIKADALHYKTDLAVNITVLASLFLSTYYSNIDSIACFAISIYVLWSTQPIIKDALSVLLDQEINTQDKQQIIAILHQHPKIFGFHNFRTRTSGKRIFIEAHIEMDPSLTLVEAHTISHELKDAVEKAYPNAEIIIHQDPIGYDPTLEKRF
jgi:ferrous-iron efflux pump FieF